jgi:hypothetical protein
MTAASLTSTDFFGSDGTPLSGLVPVKSPQIRQPLSVDEEVALRDAEGFDGVDYLFFRRFNDKRSSQLAAYVIDNEDKHLSEAHLAELHKKLWRHGAAPLVYVAWETRVDILSCARGPDFWVEEQYKYQPADTVDLGLGQAIKTAADISDAMQARYSAYRLVDGTFWDNPANSSLADHSLTAHTSLIQAVVEADIALQGAVKPEMRRLLLLMVLIKYLEDRRVFPKSWFGQFSSGAKQFFDVLRAGDAAKVLSLLAALQRKFKGEVFSLPQESSTLLTDTSLKHFSDLVEARTLKQQRYLWEQYSFEHLPVEVISHLYQRFVHGGHGQVYTPPFLASLLLDQVLPYSKITGCERILDPACGSGVFLVGAFRRLVHFWSSRNRWEKPAAAKLKSILATCIFGVDLDPTAIDLTAFSLSLAICDALKPDVIWSDLKFDPLHGSNLVRGDFFQHFQPSSKKGERPKIIPKAPFDRPFDIIVGNPPFESQLTAPAQRVEKQLRSDRGAIPDNQAAYLFFEQSIELLCTNGRCCMLQPAGILYNSKAVSFRNSIFKKYHVNTVLDFVSVRGLFAPADPKVVALLAQRTLPCTDGQIDHLTFRRTFSINQRIGIEIDHYDHHEVSQRAAELDSHIWRTNLLGGGRLSNVAKRLRAMPTLEKYITKRRWEYGEGFIAAKKEPRNPAKFLTGLPFLPTRAFTDAGIKQKEITKVTETHFRSAYSKKRYSSPLILIKANEALPIEFWNKGPLAYLDKIVGIHAKPSQEAKLIATFKRLKSYHKTYRFACMLNGSQALVGKATAILKQDLDALPYPEDEADLGLSFWEAILRDDVLDHVSEFIRLGQDSPLLKDAADTATLEAYATTFRKLLGSVHKNLHSLPPMFVRGLICQPFSFGDEFDPSTFESALGEDLWRLIRKDDSGVLRTVRVLRFYHENLMLIVKPDRLRYWIRSTAIRDADETLVDLQDQGY